MTGTKLKFPAPNELLKLTVGRVEQLFNSFDPSPFNEKDLDVDAEAFLVGWASELPRSSALRLRVSIESAPEGSSQRWVSEAIQRYFASRAEQTHGHLHQLLRKGRFSLLVGLVFLFACLLLAQWFAVWQSGRLWPGVVSESLTIGGWVAMWQPLQIFLHDWWPIRDRERLYWRMSRMPVDVHVRTCSPSAVYAGDQPPSQQYG